MPRYMAELGNISQCHLNLCAKLLFYLFYIPFIFSETDEDFEQMPYILKAPTDEPPVNIQHITNFCQNLNISPSEIRNSVRHLS